MADPKVRMEKFLKRNEESAKKFRPPPTMAQSTSRKDLRSLFILTCADPRVYPEEMFGLRKGEANVIRNAGGRVTEDTFRSMSVMSSLVSPTVVMVVHHTDCGGMFTTDDNVRQSLAERAPEHALELEGKYFGTFRHLGLEGSVRHDVELIRRWHFLPKDCEVHGFIFEDETGKVRRVHGEAKI